MTAHVRAIVDLIEDRYAEPITLHTLSSQLNRQAAYLGNLFRKETGRTVRGHLTDVRLDRAAALLLQGFNVSAVASMVGYRSKKNFYRQFQRRFAMTPREYRTAGSETGTPASL